MTTEQGARTLLELHSRGKLTQLAGFDVVLVDVPASRVQAPSAVDEVRIAVNAPLLGLTQAGVSGSPTTFTRWSSIAAAAGMTNETRTALSELCKLAWPSVYGFLRRSGYGPDDAQDLTQSFFTWILEHNDLATLDARWGRFRSWLLGALRNFLTNERRRSQALKRGGGIAVLSLDAIDAENRYKYDPADLLTPELMYERRWALTILGRVMARLEQEYTEQDKRKLFRRLMDFLVRDDPPYEGLAAELGEKPVTLRVQVHRLRRRYRDLLRDEIANTVELPADIDDELRNLLAALS